MPDNAQAQPVEAVLQRALASKVRRIAIETRRVVDSTLGGLYHSLYKGQGIEFESVRPYAHGDDIRNLDWNVTARTGQAHTKQFIEERELNVMVVFDGSGSSSFGTVSRPKRELAAEVGAALALSAIVNNDKVGLVRFSQQVDRFVMPRRGNRHALHLIREMLQPAADESGTDLGLALRVANQLLKQRSIVFVISDFLVEPDNYFQQLLLANADHDLVALVVTDPLETQWRNVGMLPVVDAESGAEVWVDTGSRRWRRHFEERAEQLSAERERTLNRAKVEHVVIAVDQNYEDALVGFFRQRLRRR